MHDKNEKKECELFAIKCAVFCVFLIGLLLVIIPEYKDGYMGSLLDKYDRIMNIKDPKVVLIGNSNLIFGIDSRILEEELGMPVVNMGLHGGLGNAFHERMIQFNVVPGDIYVVCNTTYWDEDCIDDPVLGWIAVENHPRLWKLVKSSDYADMYEAFSTYIKHALLHHANYEDYSDKTRYDFNQYGDNGQEREHSGFEIEGDLYPMTIGDNDVSRINEWNSYVRERGAYLVVAGYPILDCEQRVSDEYYIEAQIGLANNLECDYISDFRDYLYPYEMFDGTRYHLTSEGARIRTRQLAQDIKMWKKTNCSLLDGDNNGI